MSVLSVLLILLVSLSPQLEPNTFM
jgi:hypothetical protein